MEVINSYKCKIINMNDVFLPTLKLYRAALSYIIDVVNNEWPILEDLLAKEKVNRVEKFIHETKNNPSPKYKFDEKFYKFPSYFRRSAIQSALGIVSSYKSNLSNYEEERYDAISNGRKFKKKAPKLNLNHFHNPIFYKGNMFNKYDRTEMLLKLYINNDWVWKSVKLREQDIKYIEKNCYSLKESNPALVKQGRNYYLQFSYESKVKLSETKVKEHTIVAVDLGVNHSAVCSALKADGTVIDRCFINQSIEKDRMHRLLNRSKKKYKETGGKFRLPRVWNKINNLNTQITNDTVNKIVYFAIKNNANTIVFEYLDFKGKKPRNAAMKLQMWSKRDIQKKTTHKAHSNGIRVRRVCANNTSLLAFDGSGIVARSSENASNCTFKSGKKYNCDLNATYNIGARYFIKEYQKATSVKKWSQLEAKVPSIARRTQCTLSTLINLVAVL